MKSFTYTGAGLCILGAHLLLVGKVVGLDSRYKAAASCKGEHQDTCKEEEFCVDSASKSDGIESWKVCMGGLDRTKMDPVQVSVIRATDTTPSIDIHPGYFYRAPEGDGWYYENFPKDHFCKLDAVTPTEDCCVAIAPEDVDQIKLYEEFRTGLLTSMSESELRSYQASSSAAYASRTTSSTP